MEYLVKINTIASFNIAQLCALKMIKAKNRKKAGGSIVNMSSQMGHVSGPKRSVYSMNKFGLEGLTKGMSLDLAKFNIRVNTVCPTFVVTSMTKKFLKNKKFKKICSIVFHLADLLNCQKYLLLLFFLLLMPLQ